MLGRIAGILFVLSALFGIASGNAGALAEAVFAGASDALRLVLSLLGMMALWCGILRVLREAGAISLLARLMRPLLCLFFPVASRYPEIAGDIAASMAANMLGVGNAATPMAISAMQKLQAINEEPERASADMITLAVQGTAPISLVPSTILTILRSAGAKDPFVVILPIWAVSLSSWILALLLCRIFGGLAERRRMRRGRVVYEAA